MGRVTNFFACYVVEDGELKREDVWVRNGVIVDPADVQYTADVSVDCQNAIIAPGFIDTKLNGVLGVHFSDLGSVTEEKLATVRRFLPYTGVTFFCPTIETSPPEKYAELIPRLKISQPSPTEGAGLLGVHLDGPFISKVGAHKDEYAQEFGEHPGEKIKEVYGKNIENVAIVTMAPDLPGTRDAVKHLTRVGVKVSLGHTNADYEVAKKAVESGATMISHLFNAMPDFHHRDPGVVGLLCDGDLPRPVMFTIISDNYHMHPAALRMAYRINPDALCLCTDGQAPMGCGPGLYQFGDRRMEVREENGKAKCYTGGSDVLYGSVCPMNRAVRNLVNITECNAAFALEAASKKPAIAMGLYPRKGSLRPGSDADFVILEHKTMNVVATFIAGQKVADNALNKDVTALLPLTVEKPEFYSPSLSSVRLPAIQQRITQ